MSTRTKDTLEKTDKNGGKTAKNKAKKMRLEIDHSAKFYPIMSTKKAQKIAFSTRPFGEVLSHYVHEKGAKPFQNFRFDERGR